MHRSKITRNHHCNIHTDQKIISICLQSDCYRPVLCIECIKDTDIHPAKHKIESLEDFCISADKMKVQNKPDLSEKETIAELRETAKNYKTSLKAVKENIELEKKMVGESINDLISAFVMRCHHVKEEICNSLDKQAAIFNRNYKSFVKLVNGIPDSDEAPTQQQSLFESVNRSATYNQIETLLKEFNNQINATKNQPKQFDDHLINLKTIAHTLRDDTTYPCTTIMSNLDFETVKASLIDGVDKFFERNLKLKKEFMLLGLNPQRFDSQIAKEGKAVQLISDFFKGTYKEPVYTLLYRGSRDGPIASAFHRKCDNKGPTLTIIESTKGQRFGGYTDADWKSDEKYATSKNSFLFSLDFNEKYPVKSGHEQYAIKSLKGEGPCFGGGHDLRLSADFKIEESTGYIGFSYEVKNKYAKDVYGDTAFYVREIEVYGMSEGLEEDDDEPISAGLDVRKVQEEQKNEYDHEESDGSRVHLDDWMNGDIGSNQNIDNTDHKNNIVKETVGQHSRSNIASDEQFETLIDWIDKRRDFSIDLIYRGTRDGFSSDSFHKKCDNKGPTLTLIKSKKFDQIFGGFTKQPWDKSNQPGKCSETFVFSLTKNRKLAVLDEESAIFKSGSAGPVFGNGDIYICSDCDKSADSYSNLGVGFDATNMNNSVAFFAGEESFMVKEMEVFQVNFLE